jgi:hypothetical protein
VVLRKVLAPDVLPVRCDLIHLRQVILNLVIGYSGESSSRRNFLVSVAAERDVGRVRARTFVDRKDRHWEQRTLKSDQ